jgi:hypothetical protein
VADPSRAGTDFGPHDGEHYGPGETPRVGDEIMSNPDLIFDYSRKEPPSGVEPIRFVG